ncbi:MAG TPA: Sir2 family NAD-dependent protein deacetylase [Actinomycetota bacterium]|nr:Sir2 family NAD-dependent protein deacetylase [Actinomycetota bacterium]
MAETAGWVGTARRVVALTGAGISTESGIPDFRGPDGVWTRDPAAERMSHLGAYMADPEVRRRAWRARLVHPGWTARPNDGHRALAELAARGRLHTLVTQNIDGLHQMAGFPSDRLIEIHGTMREVVCMGCGRRAPMQTALERVRAGDEDPACRACGGILKSATISFGQRLQPDDVERAVEAASTCDVFLAIGTSLVVQPVALLPVRALRAGARLAILNSGPTPLDGHADAVVGGALGAVLPELARLV